MSDHPIVDAWENHQELVDEKVFTPWAREGWSAWNGQSPELEVCEFVRSLVKMMRPRLILETGVGQGYMTRTIAPLLGDDQLLISYESDDEWRAALWSLPFWTENRFAAQISHNPTPLEGDITLADLCIIDSGFDYRFAEIELWQQSAKPGAVALIHDTGEQHHDQTVHVQIKDWIVRLGMTGFFLHNPRGCFVAVQP